MNDTSKHRAATPLCARACTKKALAITTTFAPIAAPILEGGKQAWRKPGAT